jgi:putative ABC transport system permease protein
LHFSKVGESMSLFAQDLRFAFRRLCHAPGFSLVIVLTLAFGIGATCSIFSLVEGILLRPLPFHDPDGLVLLGDHLREGPNVSVTAREIRTYAAAASAFSSVGGYIPVSYEISGGATPEEVKAARFTTSVFTTLGVRPILGRLFTEREEDAAEQLAVISYSLWLTRYQHDPRILGTSITLDRKPYSIIGVMPRGFEFPLEDGRLDQAQLWVPMSFTPEELSEDRAGFWGYQMVARLKDGVSIKQAAGDADRVAQQIMRDFPASQSAIHIRGDVLPLFEYGVGEVRPLLRILSLAVLVVLLAACANVASLLLVRAIRRRREYAVRLALGASSRAVVLECVAEGLLLGLAGGLAGLALSAIVIRTTLHLLPESMPRVDSIAIDGGVAAFALLLSLMTGIFCSLAPALGALKANPIESLKAGGPNASASASHAWLRSALLVAEIAVALILVTTSFAFLRSFQKMQAVDPGFRADHVLTASFRLPLAHYPTAGSSQGFSRAVVDRLSAKPGVLAVGIANTLPGTGLVPQTAYTTEGQTLATWKLRFAMFATTYGDYFSAMRIPLIEGRYFTQEDRANAPAVLIVNRSMAERCWPGQSAIGKRLHAGNPKKTLPWATVVGVVADTKMGSRDEPSNDQWYTPVEQPTLLTSTDPSAKLSAADGGYIALRSALPPDQLTDTLRATIAEIDPLLALQEVQTMDEALANIEAPRRFNTSLITAFAVGAILLVVTGIYAVVAFSVSLRTQEIAIRMALGAQRASIARLVLTSGAKVALAGCGLGVLGALALSRLVSSFLFEVSATDPRIYVVAAATMLFMVLLASALPAKQAASAEPLDSLRSS